MIQKQEFELSARKLDGLVEEAKTRVFESRGRSQALLDALLKTSSQADANRILPELVKSLSITNDLSAEYGILFGRYQENTRYMQECDALINAAGGEKALAALMNVPYPVESEIQDVEKV